MGMQVYKNRELRKQIVVLYGVARYLQDVLEYHDSAMTPLILWGKTYGKMLSGQAKEQRLQKIQRLGKRKQ